MQKRWGDSSLFIIFLIQILFGCAPTQILAKPEWRVEGIRIDRIDLSGVSLALAIHLTNPNAVRMTVQHLSYQFYLHDVEIASGEKSDPFELPGRGSVEIVMPVEVRLKQARELAPMLKGAPEEMDYRMEGEVTLKAMGIERQFLLHHAGKK